MKYFIVALIGLISVFPAFSEAAVSEENSFLEGYNQAMFKINDSLDSVLLRPLAKGYHAVTPDLVEQGVVNVFANLGEITNVINDLLQGKGYQALNDTGRFLVNSTAGVVGLFDVASQLGMEKSDGEDFGQTLGSWGVGSGSYLVLPLLGPSTLRDAPGRWVDSLTNPVGYVDHVPTRNSLHGTRLLSIRTELLDLEALVEGDEYQFLKDAYLQRREYLVEDGVLDDDFGSYDDY